MKANRKFLEERDDAVSPVIAVILMVAITVVLAATVYVWVSGFGSQSGSPAKSIALTSGGQLVAHDSASPTCFATAGNCKSYVVAAASPGMTYADMTYTLSTGETFEISSGMGALAAPTGTVNAGDTIVFAGAHVTSGATLRILDANANSIMLTLTVT